MELEANPRLVSVKPISESGVNGVEKETQLLSITFEDNNNGGVGPTSSPTKPGPAGLGPGPDAGGQVAVAKSRKISAEQNSGNQGAACPPAQSSRVRPTLPFLRDIKNRGAEAAASPSGPQLPFLVDIRNRNPSKFSHLVEDNGKRLSAG